MVIASLPLYLNFSGWQKADMPINCQLEGNHWMKRRQKINNWFVAAGDKKHMRRMGRKKKDIKKHFLWVLGEKKKKEVQEVREKTHSIGREGEKELWWGGSA